MFYYTLFYERTHKCSKSEFSKTIRRFFKSSFLFPPVDFTASFSRICPWSKGLLTNHIFSDRIGNSDLVLVFQTTLCAYHHAGCTQTPRSRLSENSSKERLTSRYKEPRLYSQLCNLFNLLILPILSSNWWLTMNCSLIDCGAKLLGWGLSTSRLFFFTCHSFNEVLSVVRLKLHIGSLVLQKSKILRIDCSGSLYSEA